MDIQKEYATLMEAYNAVYENQEQLDEARTDPRGRPASGPMNVYGGRGRDAGPGGSGNANVDRMDAAQRRVKATQPAKKGRAADALFTKYSARQRGAGGEEGPGPNAPRRGGRSGRGAETDRGSGNAAQRRMKEDFDLFDTILEHLVAEGYADTNKAALAIMANMSEDWKQSILSEDPVQDYRDMRRADQNRAGARGPELSHDTKPGLKGKPQPGSASITQKPAPRGREFTNPPS